MTFKSIRQVAEETGLSEYWLRMAIRTHEIPAFKIGTGRGKYLIDPDELGRYIKEKSYKNIEKPVNPNPIRKINV